MRSLLRRATFRRTCSEQSQLRTRLASLNSSDGARPRKPTRIVQSPPWAGKVSDPPAFKPSPHFEKKLRNFFRKKLTSLFKITFHARQRDTSNVAFSEYQKLLAE